MAIKKPGLYSLLNVSGIILLCLLILSGISVYLAPRFGWRVDVVRSDSMSPEIQRGTLVAARPVPPEQIRLNDIIIFHTVDGGKTDICHRVVAINRNPLSYRTKGDAYAIADPSPVPYAQVVAKVMFHMPAIGYIALFMKTMAGFALTVVLPGIGILFLCVRAALSEIKKKPSTGA